MSHADSANRRYRMSLMSNAGSKNANAGMHYSTE